MLTAVQKCIIVDDEPAAHYVLINYIRQNPDLELVAQCYNGYEAIRYLKENAVDLMFLDIDMPEITGMELLKVLPSQPKTILTTAYSEFALESYDYGVIDYLLKPIYFPRFLKSVERFFSMIALPESVEEKPETTISIKVDGYFVELELNKILYAQSFGNYVKIFTLNKIYLASTTTNDFEKALPESLFLRIHKSYIIALDKIDDAGKEHVTIRKNQLPIGITYRRELQERLNK